MDVLAQIAKMEAAESAWKAAQIKTQEITERLNAARHEHAVPAKIAQLEKLHKIFGSEEARLLKQFHAEKARLIDTSPKRSGLFMKDVLLLYAETGHVHQGHRVWVKEGESDDEFAVELWRLDSPIATAVYEKRVGDTVQVRAPGGLFQYQIVGVEVMS
jgi:hypothetical protein